MFLINNKVNLLLNEQKVIIEGNISIYEIVKKNSLKINSISEKNTSLKNNSELCDYDFLYCDQT